MSYSLALSGHAGFTLDSADTGTIAPRSSVTVQIASAAVDASSTANVALQGTLTITTSAANLPSSSLPVSVTPRGATFTLTPATADFGTAFVGQPAPAVALQLANTGNLAANLSFGAATDGQFGTSQASVALAAGASSSGVSATFLPTGTTPANATIALVSDVAVCGQSANSLSLSGRGSADAVLVSGDIDFGTTYCGQTAASATVTLTNTTNASFDFLTSFARAAGYTVSPSTGTVPSQGSVTLTVTPPAIPASVATLPGNFGDTLQIDTDIDSDPTHLVQLLQGAKGAILAFAPSSLDFGGVPVNSTQTASLVLTNSGNDAAEVALAKVGDRFGATPVGTQTVAAGGTLSLSTSFSPTDITSQTGEVQIAASGATVLCQPIPSSVALSGQGKNGGVALSTQALDFGQVDCGTQATSRTFTVQNTGNAAVAFSGALALGNSSPHAISCAPASGATGSSCVADASSGSIAPGETVVFTVAPRAIPQSSSVAAGLYDDAFTFTTDVIGDQAHTIALKESARGAIFTVSPLDIDFGRVAANSVSLQNYTVANSGNVAADVTSAVDNAFFTVGGAVQVAAGGSRLVNVSFSPGLNTQEQRGAVTLSVPANVPLCAPMPTPAVAVVGRGENGQVAFTPASLDFGSVDCGTTASPQQVTFTNQGNAPYTVTGTLGRGTTSPYTLTFNPTNRVVAANGGTLTVTVTPKSIPATVNPLPGSFGDTLSFTTTVIGDTQHDVPLTEGARGVILTLSTTTPGFGSVPVGSRSTATITVTNKGNVATTALVSNVIPSVFTFDASTALSANSSALINGAFQPAAATAYSGTADFAVPNGTVLCAALPATQLRPSGTGNNNQVISITPSTTLAWGFVNCGTQAGGKTFNLNNAGASDVTFNTSFPSGNAYYDVSPASGTVPAGSSVVVTVTPKVIPVAFTTSVNGNFFGDTLNVQTSAPSDPGRTVTLTMTAKGAILAWENASYTVNNGATGNARLLNRGNASAAVTVSMTQPTTGTGRFVLSPTDGAAPATTGSTGFFATSITNSGVTGGANNPGYLNVTSPDVICQPLPSGVLVRSN